MTRAALLVVVALASCVIGQSLRSQVIVRKLSPPDYPRLALNARIAGKVELNVAIRSDGSVESVAVVSGHPLLTTAAVESAHQTEFECKECQGQSTPYRMTYDFELGEVVYCDGIDANGNAIYKTNAGTQVTVSEGTITIFGHARATCDPSETISFLKFRSAKCLYLWHCGKQRLQ
jgi:TonB family protein